MNNIGLLSNCFSDGQIDNNLTSIDKFSLEQYHLSLDSCSNASSNILLEDVLDIHQNLMHEGISDFISNSYEALVPSTNTHRTCAKTWKSSLNKFSDPVKLFEQSVSSCSKCQVTLSDYKNLHQFINNQCRCDLGVADIEPVSNRTVTKPKLLMKSSSPDFVSQAKISTDDQKQVFRPRFGKPKVAKIGSHTASNSKDLKSQIDFDKEEEDNKAHSSNVAKITFRTAKDQLLATNPAAKRSLGATRKAQGKFISPMIGAQDKHETTETTIMDDRLKHLDPKMVELIESEIIDKGSPIGWEDIAGLQMAKSVIQEAVVWPLLRPDIFTGLRRPPKGILLFGPPGTGKTLIGKCVAAQCNATFFSISASSLTSKWIGDGEKMVRALFSVARCHQPAVIFIDEIDSLLTQRSDSEHEATRRIKTEFLVQFDGAATEDEDRLLIVGATNRPQELDEAARRRLVKRLYIPLPDADARKQIISNLLKNEINDLTTDHIADIANLTDGYSGADMKSLCSEAAMGPIRSVPLSQIVSIDRNKVRPVCVQDFTNALQRVRPSVSQDDLGQYVKWNKTYGQGF